MENRESKVQNDILKHLPSIDTLLRSKTAHRLVGETGANHLGGLARFVTDSLRREILTEIDNGGSTGTDYSREFLQDKAERRLEYEWRREQNKSLRRVINATGVIIHTNLGRAPLSEKASNAIVREGSRYCSLEYDIETGKRGKRGARAENLLAELTGAEAALIVNNCAAAAVLVLTALSKGGEAIISRGELVEIGGDFRVPDVMEQSGAELVEVGTTNRTSLEDYRRAVTENTRLILKVHPSNYRIVGFTSAPSVSDLSGLARESGVLLYEDAGSGAMIDLSKFGMSDEPIISHSVSAGADVVSFSGDKLLGGPQAGLIVGRGKVIEQIRKHPLYRAFRVSKIIYAALESTFDAFRKENALEDIPVLRMLSATEEELDRRTREFASKLREGLDGESGFAVDIASGKSVVGGGSAPAVQPKTTLLRIVPQQISVNGFENKLRASKPAVVTRVLKDSVVLDLRTVAENEEAELLEILVGIGRDG